MRLRVKIMVAFLLLLFLRSYIEMSIFTNLLFYEVYFSMCFYYKVVFTFCFTNVFISIMLLQMCFIQIYFFYKPFLQVRFQAFYCKYVIARDVFECVFIKKVFSLQMCFIASMLLSFFRHVF